ncbi:hypothetical protein CDL15_Pgr008518 [Punica granatum]|nr:hypothetical protein CDL15_Pgr008518 [Punica granatum]
MHATDEAYNGRAYVVSKHECSDRIDPSLYFLRKDLHVGNTMTLQFIEKTNPAVFFPGQVVRLFPFSSGRLAEILNRFLVKISSAEADEIEKTLKICEMVPAFDEEHRQCVTSLESMINCATTRVGKGAKAVTTSVDKDTQSVKRNYTIKRILRCSEGTGWRCAIN